MMNIAFAKLADGVPTVIPPPAAFITVSSLSITACPDDKSMLSPRLLELEQSKTPPEIVRCVLLTVVPQSRLPARYVIDN